MEESKANHEPREHLSDRAAALWRDVVPRRAKSKGRIAIVQAVMESLDRADTARAAVEVAGMTTTTKTTGAVQVHPLEGRAGKPGVVHQALGRPESAPRICGGRPLGQEADLGTAYGSQTHVGGVH